MTLHWSTWNPLSRNGCNKVHQIYESHYAVLTTVLDPVKKDFRGKGGGGWILNFNAKYFSYEVVYLNKRIQSVSMLVYSINI